MRTPPSISERRERRRVLRVAELQDLTTLICVRSSCADADQLFSIDDDGQIYLAQPLDRETSDVHVLTVAAATDASPPLTAFTEVIVQVRRPHPKIISLKKKKQPPCCWALLGCLSRSKSGFT